MSTCWLGALPSTGFGWGILARTDLLYVSLILFLDPGGLPGYVIFMERQQYKKRAGKHKASWGLRLEMAHHHFYQILLSRIPILWEETSQGCEYQEVEIIGYHLEGWLPEQ